MATLLVIDDEESVRRSYRLPLRRVPGVTEIVEASSGEEGLRMFRQDPSRYDVMIVDYLMPGMDGLAFLVAIHGRTRSPRFITSARLDPDLFGKVKLHGGRGLLYKPVPSRTLQKVVTELIRYGGYSSALDHYEQEWAR